MRRSPALMLTLALVASFLGITSSASAIVPGDTPDTGNLYVDPTSFEVGQSVKLTANFPSGVFMVTYYKKVSDTEWTSIGSDESNTSGNAYLHRVVNAQEEIYARITSGGPEGRTETKVLNPTPAGVIAPNGPDTGNLYQDPATYSSGDAIRLTANFPSGTFPITLYKEGPADTWTAVATKTSNSSGNAYFYDFPVTAGSQRLFARKANNDRTEVDVIAPTPSLDLSIRRDCPTQNCDSTASAYGELDPVQQGRQAVLQYKSGTSWVPVVGASPASTGADGKVKITFPVADLPQWTTRDYRLTIATDGSNPAVTSLVIKFMPGPTELGTNVLYVDVDKGIYPTTKGPEYTGEATLSVNGTPKLDHVKLENFGVRGTSTAHFDKRAYKLKFDKSPKDVGVFGMPADKSWSLLANWLDRSNVRDKVGLELGRMMGHIFWTPQSRYVELFVNDQYRGAYLMTESVKLDGDRVDVDEEQGMIMETDGRTVDDSLLGFMSSKGIPFQFKDPDERKTLDGGGADPTGVTSAKLSAIKSKVNTFESRLYSSTTREQYPNYIDVDSAIDFYLVKEFTKDRDADFFRSNYFSWDPSDPNGTSGKPLRDGKFHFGPAWDFDRSAGITSEDDTIHNYVQSPSGFYLRGTGIDNDHPNYKTHWFVQLFKSQTFRDKVDARWLQVDNEVFAKADDMARDFATEIGVGAENDRKRWVGPRKYASHGTYQGEIDYVANWYASRYTWLNNNL